ncbi:MAG: tRNA (cytidine(56)-2'-O)-methyltransferase [Candidatus Altiarchaeales archaeon]|nr:tRNA (cytidine(56)-2'-O)-methyltransferase [Candidatus Altiarchaeota archaeon]MBU4341924.1 tRNA (cytidine(56)-2'-O)-methyltransferase [Candidatus Altiarchaeota archaeon]MBU4406548.1 tRNA (cytidine(56)-2'-O)-methyltransferase [Candidatus Altiarchaeota archaeon]MCG2783096.1 tRNA (cytidine(56)-2'-O)-methyltransferase [Candidatus Altiarchaeales archaeon]
MKVKVLRLGHRYSRDRRISTHVGLVARAFGADELLMDVEDKQLGESITGIAQEWGGEFTVSFINNRKKFLREFDGEKIHLTMYGINVDDCIGKIKSSRKDKLIIIGGQKVPSDLYELVDHNIAIGSQPHSEVAALSIFLDRLFDGKELGRKFNGRKEIIPQERGKKVIEK